jgi:uncharacterized protein YbjT (DUF2867 family)
MILVTGGTGTTGRELVRLLQQSGEAFRVLSRDATRAHSLLGDDVDVFQGDMNEPEGLAAAFVGVDTLFLLAAPDPSQVEQEGRTLEVAEAAGVRRVVKVSVLGAADDSPVSFGRWHAYTERQLRDSSFVATILRPHAFMQNTLAFAPAIAATGRFAAPMRDGRIGMIDARDVAAVAHAVLTSTTHDDRTVDLTGAEAVSYDDVARILSEELGKPVHYDDVPPNEAEKTMLQAGLPSWYADALLTWYALFAAGHASECTPTVQEITGRAPRSYRTFVRDHLDAFRVE